MSVESIKLAMMMNKLAEEEKAAQPAALPNQLAGPLGAVGHTKVESIKEPKFDKPDYDKYATGDTREIPPPPEAQRQHADTNTQALMRLFESRDGLAQNSKKDLRRYFDITNPLYAMREQTLVEKVASVLKK
jgi:hypothetical protein